MSRAPDEQIDLGETSSGHDKWIELYISRAMDNSIERVRAVQKDSKPVHNESTYRYKNNGSGLEFVSGDKSCSGAGKSRSVSPPESISEAVRDKLAEVVES